MAIYLGNTLLTGSSGGSGSSGGGTQINQYAAFHVYPSSVAVPTFIRIQSSATDFNIDLSDPGVATPGSSTTTYTIYDANGVLIGTTTTNSGQHVGSSRYAATNTGGVGTHFFDLGGANSTHAGFVLEGDASEFSRYTSNWNNLTGLYTPTDGGVYLATGSTLEDLTNQYPQAQPIEAANSQIALNSSANQTGSRHSSFDPNSGLLIVTSSAASGPGPEGGIGLTLFEVDGDGSWSLISSGQASPPSSISAGKPGALTGTGSGDRAFLNCYDVANSRYLMFWARNNGVTTGTGGFIFQNTTTIDTTSASTFNSSFGSANWVDLTNNVRLAGTGANPISTSDSGATWKLECDPNSGEIFLHYVDDASANIIRSFNSDGTNGTTYGTGGTAIVADSPASVFNGTASVTPVDNAGTTEWWWQENGEWFMSTGFNVAGTNQFSGGIVSGTAVNPPVVEAVTPTSFIGYQDTNLYLSTPQARRLLGDDTVRSVEDTTGNAGTLAGLNGNLDQVVFLKIG